uniref:HNH endonuclease n=1 Tax=Salmonella phage SalP219 TaxID=3158864 RepID=A0AAU7PIQ4_9CAUD
MGNGPDWGSIVEYRDGKLYWKVNTFSGRNHNHPAAVIGKEAGSISGKGYCTIRFQGYRCYRHVIVWLLHHGPIPKGLQVDHIKSLRETGGVADDRITNLQLLTRGTNTRKGGGNMPNSSNKSSARRGVSWDRGYPSKPWRARITVDGKVLLKNFDSFNEASQQRELWEKEYCYGGL